MIPVTEAAPVEMWHNFSPVSEDWRAKYFETRNDQENQGHRSVKSFLGNQLFCGW